MSPYPVVIIEDEVEIREAVASALRFSGHEVTAIGDVRSATRVLARLRGPALFLVDLVLPGLDGWTLVEKIRLHGLKHEVCHGVAIMSGLGNASSIAHLEGVAFLPKPYNLDRLYSVLNALAARAREDSLQSETA